MELIFPIHCQNTKFGETIFAIYVLQVKLARTVSHVDALHILLQEIWLAELFPKFETLKKWNFRRQYIMVPKRSHAFVMISVFCIPYRYGIVMKKIEKSM